MKDKLLFRHSRTGYRKGSYKKSVKYRFYRVLVVLYFCNESSKKKNIAAV